VSTSADPLDAPHRGTEHRSSSIPEVTGGILSILQLPMSFGHEGVRKNTGTSTAPNAEHTDLRAHYFAHSPPLVT